MDRKMKINLPGKKVSYKPNKCILEAALDCNVYEGKLTRQVLKVQTKIKCAVKVIRPNSLEIDMELLTNRELQALLCQEHNNVNIILCYDALEVDQTVYLIMERFDCSLKQMIMEQERNGCTKLNPPCELTKKEIMKQTTEGVRFLHNLGILHRNLNPTNIVIARYWNRNGKVDKDVVKITDFMLSKRMRAGSDEASLSGRNVEMEWAAPEILLQLETITSSADIFSLGCVFYFVLEGKHPYGNTANLINAQVSSQPIILTTDFLIKSMIHLESNDRPTIDQISEDPFLRQGEFYTLYDGRNIPGLCIIINLMEFHDRTLNRYGSDKDRDNLSKMFSSFGYDVEIHENLTESNFNNIIAEYSQRSYVHYLSIVVCILSHGDEEVIYTGDYRKIAIQGIKDAFASEKCPSLDGKPKMFIIQACRGKVGQKTSLSGLPAVADTFGIGVSGTDRSDVLDIRATVPGFPSYRLPASGSLLIRQLVNSLTNEKDLTAACTDVNDKIAKFKLVKQMPEEISCLRKNIRFRTGYRKGGIRFIT